MATAEFSRFAGILSAALSQHHLLGFEIAQLEFHLFIVMFPKAHLTSHSRMSFCHEDQEKYVRLMKREYISQIKMGSRINQYRNEINTMV